MIELSIDHKKCITCGKCIKICPANLFSNNDGKITVNNGHCISCGHCVAVCPPEAIRHSEFPEEKIHKFDRKDLPTAESLELLINSRRSNRAFSGNPVPSDYLKRIIEAAHRAPTATNLQEIGIVVITDPKVLHSISEITINKFYSLAKILNNSFLKPIIRRITPDNYKYVPEFIKMKDMFDSGKDPILRGATAAIFFIAPDKCRFGSQDANLAYQNASLLAEALEVAHFYTGFVCTAAGMDKQRKLQKLLGISGTIHAGMALGMPQFKFERYIDKKDLSVKFI